MMKVVVFTVFTMLSAGVLNASESDTRKADAASEAKAQTVFHIKTEIPGKRKNVRIILGQNMKNIEVPRCETFRIGTYGIKCVIKNTGNEATAGLSWTAYDSDGVKDGFAYIGTIEAQSAVKVDLWLPDDTGYTKISD